MTSKSDGVQGYSSPNKKTVVFSVCPENLGRARSLINWLTYDKWPGLYGEGRGCWQGEEEPAFYMDEDIYLTFVENRGLTVDQVCVLVLGNLKAQNHRDAHLQYGDGETEHIGVWHEVTEQEAREHNSWSCFGGKWFIVTNNPARCEQDKKDRIRAQNLLDAFCLWRATALCADAARCRYQQTHYIWPQFVAEDKDVLETVSNIADSLIGETLPNGVIITDDNVLRDAINSRVEYFMARIA